MSILVSVTKAEVDDWHALATERNCNKLVSIVNTIRKWAVRANPSEFYTATVKQVKFARVLYAGLLATTNEEPVIEPAKTTWIRHKAASKRFNVPCATLTQFIDANEVTFIRVSRRKTLIEVSSLEARLATYVRRAPPRHKRREQQHIEPAVAEVVVQPRVGWFQRIAGLWQ